MHTTTPPTLETFDHWPSWLNARGHLDRSACFELKVSDLRRLTGCIPLKKGQYGKEYRAKGRAAFNVPDLPNEKKTRNGKGRISSGWYDLSAYQIDLLARLQMPRALGGDWRTGRAPAMRPDPRYPYGSFDEPASNDSTDGSAAMSEQPGDGSVPSRHCSMESRGMTLKQGGYGPGSYGYEQAVARSHEIALGMKGQGLDAGLEGNPNRGASREKRFGIDWDWHQWVWMEKWAHNSVSGVQYFLICPGAAEGAGSHGIGCANAAGLSSKALRSTVDAKGLKGLTGTTSNCGDGSRGAHGKSWVCGQRVYKLFWVLGRETEHRDALLAEQWIASLSSGQLARQSAAVSALVDRYGPIMGDDRLMRCRRCLKLRYGQSPEVLRRMRRRRAAS